MHGKPGLNLVLIFFSEMASNEIDSMFWSEVKGIPKKCKWPVKVVDWGEKAGCNESVLVYCRSDDA